MTCIELYESIINNYASVKFIKPPKHNNYWKAKIYVT